MWLRSAEALRRLLTVPFGSLLGWLRRGSLKRRLGSLVLVAVLAVTGGLVYAWSGLFSISASSGHWAATSWLLHFSMRSAVRTQSMGIKAPVLEDEMLVLKGAGHYATGCAACHGAPGEPQSLIARQMTPEPPYLPPRIKEWAPEELFWIVRNGIKFTAMPAWPALQRDDEVWALVAFIRKLPEMTPARYRQLAYGPSPMASPGHLRPLLDPAGPGLADCARCHGEEGLGRDRGAFPKLAGQTETYLLASLRAYAGGERQSGIMQPIAAGLDERTLQALARHYAELPADGGREVTPPPAELLAEGGELATQGQVERGVPGCTACHGPRREPRNQHYPNLAGQYPEYLALQLRLFHEGTRGGTEYAQVMHSAARRLTPAQIETLARYYGSLPWQGAAGPQAAAR
jgi:cytochrome c553